MSHQTVLLTINGITGHLCDLKAELTWVIGDIKQAIQMQMGVPTFQQTIVAKGNLLENSTPLLEGVSSRMQVITEKDMHFLNGTKFTMIRVPHVPPSFLRDWCSNIVPKELRADRETVMSVLQALRSHDDDALSPADPMLRADREVVLTAVGWNGRRLKDASPELKANRELVMTALNKSGSALEFAADELKREVEVVRAAVMNDGLALQHAAPELKSHHDIGVLAVQQNVDALQYAPHLQRNRSVVLDAVSRNAKAVRYAGDRDIVLHALHCDIGAMWVMDDQWLEDFAVSLAIVMQDGWLLKYLPEKYRSNLRMVYTAVRQNGWALRFASASLRANPKVVAAAVQKHGLAIQYAAPALRGNRRIAELAVRQEKCAFHHVASQLQSDKDFRLFAGRFLDLE